MLTAFHVDNVLIGQETKITDNNHGNRHTHQVEEVWVRLVQVEGAGETFAIQPLEVWESPHVRPHYFVLSFKVPKEKKQMTPGHWLHLITTASLAAESSQYVKHLRKLSLESDPQWLWESNWKFSCSFKKALKPERSWDVQLNLTGFKHITVCVVMCVCEIWVKREDPHSDPHTKKKKKSETYTTLLLTFFFFPCFYFW